MKKTVVITGANSGIGKAAAIQFAEQGYQVVMACRNIETSKRVCKEMFGPVLLTSLLLDVLAKSNDPRILNACSTNIKHFFDERRKIDFKALCGESVAGKKYDSYKLYNVI